MDANQVYENLDRIVGRKLNQLGIPHKRIELGNRLFVIYRILEDDDSLGEIILFEHNYIAKHHIAGESLEPGRRLTQIYYQVLLEIRQQGELVHYDAHSPSLSELEREPSISRLHIRNQERVITFEQPEPANKKEQKESPAIRARRLGLRSVEKLERWDRIEDEFVPAGLTQEKMAESERVSTETIRKDIKQMKTHKNEFPTTWEVYGK